MKSYSLSDRTSRSNTLSLHLFRFPSPLHWRRVTHRHPTAVPSHTAVASAVAATGPQSTNSRQRTTQQRWVAGWLAHFRDLLYALQRHKMQWTKSHVWKLTLILAWFASSPQGANGARILGAFVHVGKSHWDVFEPLMKELARRGHEVTVISHFPLAKPIANYTDISLHGTMPSFSSVGQMDMVEQQVKTLWDVWKEHQMLSSLAVGGCDAAFSLPAVQKLLHSGEHFDLLITELFTTDCFLAFAHHFKVPHIALSSSTLMPWANQRYGNSHNPAYVPDVFHDLPPRMTMWERFKNTLFTALDLWAHEVLYNAPAERVVRHYFGASVPPLEELARNSSMILVNTHPALIHARPQVPAVVEVAGIHVPPPSPLPKDLQEFLDGGKDGVIYFNMGSMLRATTMSPTVRQAFLEAFARLGKRVLWKWEEETIPGLPTNVRLSKWLPQAQVLRHRNVRVYIGHGGLLGSIEAATSGVPMVVIPIFGDQRANARQLQTVGMARRLNYDEITADSLYAAITAVLEESKYRESAQRIARIMADRPLSPLDTAVYWTEFVIRHGGTPHLRNTAAADLAWHQRCLLDAAAIALALVIVTAIAIRALLLRLFARMRLEEKLKGE